MSGYKYAKQKYERLGLDVDEALRRLSEKAISIHCWQGDDIGGFEQGGAGASGGIQTTGDYPGKARTPEELMKDFSMAISLIPGKKRINLHACYAIIENGSADRDELKPEHFAAWVDFAKRENIGIDFNPTYFSHKMAEDNLTLSSPDEKVRRFWVRHSIACRRIASWMAKELGEPVMNNIWIQDGYKDWPADRIGPRLRLKKSLDEIFEEPLDGVIDCVESKLFGIGLEAFTVGSSEFYLNYTASRPGVYTLMDNGHYHPTEPVSDKISSMLAFYDLLPLHVTRPMRWDSDHVVLLEDELKEIAMEIVRCGALDKALIGLDFFDASINRVAAWVIGTRNMQKALLMALLTPHEQLKQMQDEGRFTELMMLKEELKLYPLGEIWDHWCGTEGVPPGEDWFSYVRKYEEEELSKRS